MNSTPPDDNLYIQEVWDSNLEEEFDKIRHIVERYPYVAIDTEFPGITVRPTGAFNGQSDYNYQTIKCNVDVLNVIQLGMTFTDSQGNPPPGISTWQFNFRFDTERDEFAPESVKFLEGSGINFQKHRLFGIDPLAFGELTIASGLVMNEAVRWISFHGSFDFGYALKLLTCSRLPDTEAGFAELLRVYFPNVFDIKHLLRDITAESLPLTTFSLQSVSDALGVPRVGRQHQAGSDALVTARTFFALIARCFGSRLAEPSYAGILYGIGSGWRAALMGGVNLSNNNNNNNSANNANQQQNAVNTNNNGETCGDSGNGNSSSSSSSSTTAPHSAAKARQPSVGGPIAVR